MSADDDLTVIMFMVLGTASAIAAAAGGFFGTRTQKCQGDFTPWSPCVGACDETPTRSRTYVITSEAPDCPYIDGYTETEVCGPVSPCCELVRDWEDPGDVPCENGLKTFTRELRENKEGACAGFETERYAPCCQITGQWEAVGECDNGQQRYTKDYLGECPAGEVEKFEQCAPCVEGWDNYADGLPSCPQDANDCGYGGDKFTRTWKILAEPIGTGKACTKPNNTKEEVECPAQPPCCDYNPPATDGVCSTSGELTYTRSYVNSNCKEDPDRNNIKQYTEPCCYEAGDWTPVGQCEDIPDGMDAQGNQLYIKRQKQEQTTAGPCPDGTEERYVPCCGYTEWTPVGACEERDVEDPSGTGIAIKKFLQEIARQTGTSEGCGLEQEYLVSNLVPCCGYSAWENDGLCVRSENDVLEPSQAKIRTVLTTTPGCYPEDTNTEILTTSEPCCYEGAWQSVGQCTAEGLQQYTRTTYGTMCNETDNPTTKYEPCCYEAGDWAPVGQCNEEGLQKQVQTTAGCPDGRQERYAPCCGYTEWTPSGQCTTDGQNIIRDVGTTISECYEEEDSVLESRVPCCGYTEWENSGECTLSTEESDEPSQIMIRSLIEPSNGCFPEQEDTQILQKTVDCCYEDAWAPVDYCTQDENSGVYKQQYQRNVFGSACDETNTTTKYETCQTSTDCPGSWNEYADGFPSCPEPGVCTDGITYTRIWEKEQAPAGFVYSNCPSDETTTCPAVPCDCVQGWDITDCPTEPGFLGNDPTKMKTWRVTTAATGMGMCSNDYVHGQTAPCDATALKQIECEEENGSGSWSDWDNVCPTTATLCGYTGGTVETSRTWTTNTAPPGETYINCPPSSETKTLECSATGPCNLPCEGSWDIYSNGFPSCPTTEERCGYAGETFTRNWTTSEAPLGQSYSIDCPPASESKTCPPTGACNLMCEGEWDNYADGFPECPTECGSEEVTYTRNWTTDSAPPGQSYIDCPPAKQEKTCPAIQACASNGAVAGGALTGAIAGAAGGAAGWWCAINPGSCTTSPGSPPTIRSDVDVNCVGQFDKDVPACPSLCGQAEVTYNAKYEHIIPQQGKGSQCPYIDGHEYNRTCPATTRCCTYSTVEPLITGSSVCTGAPGLQTINLQVQKSNEPCQEDGVAPTSKEVQCQNCYGFWEADACPTGCGYQGGDVPKKWVTLLSQDDNGYGEACPPTETTITCPSREPCPQSCPVAV